MIKRIIKKIQQSVKREIDNFVSEQEEVNTLVCKGGVVEE